MFASRKKMLLTCGAAALLALRTLPACGAHFSGHCDSENCGATQGDGWRAAHDAHAHVCLCEPEAVAAHAKTSFAKISPPPFFVASRMYLPQARNVVLRAVMEKPPPGLVLKKMSQMLC